jgi:hypothetical protein
LCPRVHRDFAAVRRRWSSPLSPLQTLRPVATTGAHPTIRHLPVPRPRPTITVHGNHDGRNN